MWAWDKTKVIVAQTLTMMAEIRQVSFSPDDASTIVVTGKDYYRYFKLQDNNTLKDNFKESNLK